MAINTVKVTVNGVTVDAVSNGDGTYTATLAAPNVTSYNVNSGHYYPVTVVATNLAGTSTTVNDQTANIGSSLRLKVKELTAPTITFLSLTEAQFLDTARPSIQFNLADDVDANGIPIGSGVAISELLITVDGVEHRHNDEGVIVSMGANNSYDVVWTPGNKMNGTLEDGYHTITVEVRDNDGNYSTATRNFYTDTVAPTLSVTNPQNNSYVPNANLTITGTASDDVSGTPVVNLVLNGINQGNISVVNNKFTKEITLVSGENTIIITATDNAGKSTTITRKVILDTSSPVIASVVIDPNPVNVGKSYVVTIKVTG